MTSPLFDLSHKTALITGATRGIGLAIAREYGRAGARLAISSENAEDCERVAAQLREEGCDASPFAADLSDPAASRPWPPQCSDTSAGSTRWSATMAVVGGCLL